MRLRRLALEGFGSYHQRCELDLADVRLVAICGLNGSGKSTLVDGAIWCLYGAVPHSTNAALLNLRDDVTAMTVELEFDHEADASGQVIVGSDRHVHQVTRTWRQTSGSGSSSALHTCDGVMVADSARNVTKSITRVLGADLPTLTATMVSRQFEHGLFNALRPGERQRLLRKPLPLAEWKEKRDAAENGRLETEAELARERQDLEFARHAAKVLKDLRAEAEKAQVEAEAAAGKLADLRSRSLTSSDRRNLEQAEEAATEQEQLKRDGANAKRRHRRLTTELEEKQKKHAVAVKGSATKSNAHQKLKETVAECKARATSTKRGADEATEHLQLLEGGGLDECWVCQQPLTPAHFKKLKRKLQEPIDDHDAAQKELTRVRGRLKTAQGAAAGAEEKKDRLANDCQALENKIRRCEKDVASTNASIEANKKLMVNLEDLRQAAKNQPSSEQIKAAEKRRTTAERTAGALTERLSVTEQAASQVKEHDEAVKELSRDLEGLVMLKRAFAPSGIPRLAARAVMRGVALTANTTMRRFGSQLEMKLAGFSGVDEHDELAEDEDELSDELLVEARGAPSEPWRPYSTFSGGEQMRMDVASRLALIHTLGVRCDLVAFDEGWGNLDDPGRQAFVSLLHDLVLNGEVQQVVTITHVAETLEKFDAQISVTYDPASGSHAELVTSAAPTVTSTVAETTEP